MHVLSSRLFLCGLLVLFLAQAAIVDGKSRKEKKKIEEETAPDPVIEEGDSEPATSGRDARQHPEQPEVGEGLGVNPVDELENRDGDGAERTKKSYCASGRSNDGNYNAGEHGHSGHGQGPHGQYGRYQPEMDQYHGGGHGPSYGPGHTSGYTSHGPDMTDYHQQSHGQYGGPEGYGGDSGKGQAGYARKSQGDYGYAGQGGKGGGDLYHPAASAPSSVYRPSYQAGHESYGGGGPEYSASYGYGAHGPSYGSAPSSGGHAYAAQHEPSYSPHSYGPQAPGYGAGNMKAAYGGGAYPLSPAYGQVAYGPAAYGQGGHVYGAAPMYGPMYHSPSGYPASGYAPSAPYNSYAPYTGPSPSYQYGSSYSMPPYSHPYGYGPYPPSPAYHMHGQTGIPVTLTCSVQQEGPYDYSAHSRGGSSFYRASDNEANTNKPALTMLVVPPSQNKTQKPMEKQPSKDQQKDEANMVGDKKQESMPSRPAMTNQPKHEGMKEDPHAAMQAMGGGNRGMESHGQRESASYQRMPFSMIRQKQMENYMGPKQVFYQPNY